MATGFGYRREELNGIRLICEKEGEEWLGVDLYPDSGFKSAGLRYRGSWLQPYCPQWEVLLRNDLFGNSILFPTPNRVRDHTFVFRGETVCMEKNGVPRGQHGLALDSKWEILEVKALEDSVLARARFQISKGDENYQAFPFACSLTVSYQLYEDQLDFSYALKNLSDRAMPFGIGLHPWFLLPEDKVSLLMPAEYCFETTEDLLPTGKLIDVRGSRALDLNQFKDVRQLDLDTVYLTHARDVCIRYDERGYRIRVHVSDEFIAGVVFTAFRRGMNQKGYEAFCVETQSCCTDAINLHEKGFEQSGLLVLDPGEEKTGKISYILEESAPCEKGEQK